MDLNKKRQIRALVFFLTPNLNFYTGLTKTGFFTFRIKPHLSPIEKSEGPFPHFWVGGTWNR